MKTILLSAFSILMFTSLHAQYYYKDILLPKQTADQLQRYKTNRIRAVKATSAETGRETAEGLQVDQSFNNNYSEVVTISRSPQMEGTTLITYYNSDGLIGKTVDTTDGASSTTIYIYDASKRLTALVNSSASTGQDTEKEEHLWSYTSSGQPLSMLKIRNGTDTAYFTFVIDDKGNVVEEKSTRKGKEQLPYYYYYDDQNRLTDIVHYNPIAKRLLPDYIFEYDQTGKLRSMLVVPPGGIDYQRWMYNYDDRGLKTKETVYNRSRQPMGIVEYRYE